MADSYKQTFWEHLDVLRGVILRSLIVTSVFAVVAFCFKDQLFDIILAPKGADFITYRWLNAVTGLLNTGDTADFHVSLINTGLAKQFIIHMKMALCAGVIFASPYILYQIFSFVSPALYTDERKYAVRMIGGGYLMFAIGLAVSYLLVFPLTFRFLGTYQVDGEVTNMITLDSYISTLLTMSLSMGIIFEMPMLSWLFAKLGFLSAGFMKQYHKHAIVLILIVAAIITPTSDVFTLSLVALPMIALYELCILIVARTTRSRNEMPARASA